MQKLLFSVIFVIIRNAWVPLWLDYTSINSLSHAMSALPSEPSLLSLPSPSFTPSKFCKPQPLLLSLWHNSSLTQPSVFRWQAMAVLGPGSWTAACGWELRWNEKARQGFLQLGCRRWEWVARVWGGRNYEENFRAAENNLVKWMKGEMLETVISGLSLLQLKNNNVNWVGSFLLIKTHKYQTHN